MGRSAVRDQITIDTRSGLGGMVSDLAAMVGETTDDLSMAAMMAKIAAVADRDLGMHARSAVRNGATWQQVGDAVGISRQAAHKRFAKP